MPDQYRARIACRKRRGMILLGKFSALFVERQRKVHVTRRTPAKLFIQRKLSDSGFD